jgi:triosephosphate isomerase
VRAALGHKMTSLICVGESYTEKLRGVSDLCLERQVKTALRHVSGEALRHILFAYEPVWAIGESGHPADPDYVQERHAAIRKVLGNMYPNQCVAEVPLLYGGSVNQQNFSSYAEKKDVNGLFIGRAAWDARSFLQFVEMSRKFCHESNR